MSYLGEPAGLGTQWILEAQATAALLTHTALTAVGDRPSSMQTRLNNCCV